ncbi:WD repeat protein, partial [Corchorus capsularis]
DQSKCPAPTKHLPTVPAQKKANRGRTSWRPCILRTKWCPLQRGHMGVAPLVLGLFQEHSSSWAQTCCSFGTKGSGFPFRLYGKLSEAFRAQTSGTCGSSLSRVAIGGPCCEFSLFAHKLLQPNLTSLLRKGKKLVDLLDAFTPIATIGQVRQLEENVFRYKNERDDAVKELGILRPKHLALQKFFDNLDTQHKNTLNTLKEKDNLLKNEKADFEVYKLHKEREVCFEPSLSVKSLFLKALIMPSLKLLSTRVDPEVVNMTGSDHPDATASGEPIIIPNDDDLFASLNIELMRNVDIERIVFGEDVGLTHQPQQ